MDREANRTLISVRLQMLLSLFGRQVREDSLESLKRVYCEALENFTTEAITAGFRKAEQTCERLPSPRAMTGFCNESSRSGSWRYSYGNSTALDPETGEPVGVKVDPVTRDILYRAGDCPEGREFLRKFKEMADEGRRGRSRSSKFTIDQQKETLKAKGLL